MQNKNSKKLSLAKETLKILSPDDLARVQGGTYSLFHVLSIETWFGGGSSNSL